MEYILAFGSAHRALKAESVLRNSGLVHRLLPAPRAFTLHCDLVISLDESLLARARDVLRGAGVNPTNIFLREGDSYVEV
ncbi:MAG: DUF3343 domain-containing protein [Thermodesulfobacteriota bacterium]